MCVCVCVCVCVHYIAKSIGSPPSNERLCNKDGNIIHVLIYFHLCWNSFEVYKMTVPMYKSLVFGNEWLAQGLHFKVTPEVFSWD